MDNRREITFHFRTFHLSLPYRIERTRNRASRATLREDMVVIRLARGLKPHEEQEHIDFLLKRMAKAHVRQAKRIRIDPFRLLLEGAPSAVIDLVTGTMVNFAVREGAKTKAKRADGGWLVWRSPATDDRTFHRFLWRLLGMAALADVRSAVRSINLETLELPIKSVKLKFMSSRWGSCSNHGSVSLSTPLLLTTPEIFRYVVIHELAHILHKNHSQRFWSVVEAAAPGYAKERKKLKGYTIVRG